MFIFYFLSRYSRAKLAILSTPVDVIIWFTFYDRHFIANVVSFLERVVQEEVEIRLSVRVALGVRELR